MAKASVQTSAARTRNLLFLATGLSVLAFGILALITKNPEPFPWWILMILGLAAATVPALQHSFDTKAQVARDNAAKTSYWIALFMYPLFAIFMATGMVNYYVAFSAMSTFTGAAFLLLFYWFVTRQ